MAEVIDAKQHFTIGSIGIREILIAQNPWWQTKQVASKGKFRRYMVDTIIKSLPEKKIILITGPRQSGKSILVHQVINELIHNAIEPRKILYLSFDNPKIVDAINHDLDAIFTAYSELNNVAISQEKEIYVFLDEIQKLDKWSDRVKYWHDLNLNIYFILTGSSSMKLQKKSESLVGRINIFTLFPMDFNEFYYALTQKIIPKTELTDFKGIHAAYNETIKFKEEILRYFRIWVLNGGYPEIAFFDDKTKIKETLSKYALLTIQQDIAELYVIRDIKSIEKLIYLLADLVAQRLNYEKLANVVDTQRETIKKYLFFLEEAFLIKLAYIYSKKQYFSLRKELKVFFIDNGLRNSLLVVDAPESEMPTLVEQAVAIHIFKKNLSYLNKVCLYWLSENGYEVDSVLLGKEIIPIEVKYRNHIKESDLKGIKSMVDRYALKTAIVVTQDLYKTERYKKARLLYLPAWVFLLCL